MLKRSILAVTLLASTTAIFAQTPATPKTASDAAAQWKQRIGAWRAQRDKELSAPDGWLTLIGLEWLKSGGNSFGAAADNSVPIKAQAPEHFGIITVSGKTIQLLSYPTGFPADFQINGKPAREGQLSTDGDNPSTMTWRGITMVVLARGDRYALRIKDANSPARTSFAGLHWYAPDLNYAVEAKWIPYPSRTHRKDPHRHRHHPQSALARPR